LLRNGGCYAYVVAAKKEADKARKSSAQQDAVGAYTAEREARRAAKQQHIC